MKKILLLFFALMLVPSLKAQDVIVMIDGTIIEAKMKEIRPQQYVYEKWNGDGTLFVVDKDLVFSIKFDEKNKNESVAVYRTDEYPSKRFYADSRYSIGHRYENYTRVLFSFAATSAETEYAKSVDDYEKGFRIGFISGASLSRLFPLFLGVGGDVTYATYRKTNIKESFLKIAVPLQLSVRIGTPVFNLEPFAGIHGKFNASGKLKVGHRDYNYFDEDDMGEGLAFKRMQVGFQAGAGINIRDLHIGYEFRKDISPMQTDSKMKTMTHFASFGVSF